MVYGPRQTDLKLEHAEFDAGEARSKLRPFQVIRTKQVTSLHRVDIWWRR